uniref:Putative polyprotein n=1 Tax=Tanacetum cinerariifolium TaxID=118510 RepID=A0A6L2KSK0_TANCI|nr:putative polyprotein [Tanacetum cinerariifolium]
MLSSGLLVWTSLGLDVVAAQSLGKGFQFNEDSSGFFVLLRMDLTASFAVENSMSWATDQSRPLTKREVLNLVHETAEQPKLVEKKALRLTKYLNQKATNEYQEAVQATEDIDSPAVGILNYAQNHIPKLGILLRPLYEKTNAHRDKRLKSSDYKLVRKIKEQVQNLPDLEIPLENAYIILETDGCIEGWGGIVKWKKSKEDPRGSEKICAYASGKFSTTQSTIDAEINACINTLEKLKIYYLDKQEEIAEQPKLVEKEALRITEDLNQKATTEYQEAVQATEDIDSPAVGFAKISDYKGDLAKQVNAVIKQNNTLLYLASRQSPKLVELEEKFDKLKQKVYTIIEKEIQPADLEDSISSLAKRLDHFSISELPTQEDQIRGYRAMTRGKYQAARATRRVFGRNSYNTTLESAVDPKRQLELSRERRANLVPAELVYMFPDMVLSIDDFHNHVEVAIQTHGYDTWQGGESNLLVTMAMIAIPDERRSIEEFEGKSWNLKPSEQTIIRVPSRGDEFSDDETTPGRVTILNESEERSNWDDDERSGGKILVIQEKLAQNQQDFLEEYIPQWDDQLATQKQRSKLEWENPFAAKRGEDHTVLRLSKNEEKDDDLPYPKFRKFKQLAAQIIKKHEEHAFPIATDDAESSTSYQPLPDAIMGPIVYPPTRQNPQPAYKPDCQFGYPQGKGNTFYGGYDPGLWSDQWRTAYPGVYFALETIANDPQNITSQVRQLIIMEDPYRGSTDEQDRAYRDLDRINYEETKNLWSFLEDFRQLAIKSGKLYFPSTTEKLFAKLPPSLSKKIEESFKARHPGLSARVLYAIKFTHTFVSKMCKDAVLAKELRDLSLCSAIPILGHYKNNRKKYGIRKSRTYKGKPHNSHVNPFKRKYKDDRGRVNKCNCFICEKEGHFAKDCRSKQGNIARSAIYQELDLDDNWDIVSADFDDSSVYSISEGEYVVQSAGSWKPDKELPTQSKSCEHDWKENTVTNYTICYYCGILTTDMSRLNCLKCQLTTCTLCAKNYLGKTVNVKRKQQHKLEEEKDFSSNEEKEELWQIERRLLVRDLTDALKIIDHLKAKQMRLEEKKDEEIKKLKAQLQEKMDKEIEVQFSKENFPPLGNSQIARPFMEVEAHYS